MFTAYQVHIIVLAHLERDDNMSCVNAAPVVRAFSRYIREFDKELGNETSVVREYRATLVTAIRDFYPSVQ